jgi:hypothetical protein
MGLEERKPPGGMASERLASAVHQFRHGFFQLVLAFQAIHRDAFAWHRYLRVCAVQAVVTLAIASLSISTARSSSEGLREERVQKAMARISSVDTSPPPAAPPDPPKRPHSVAQMAHPGRNGTAGVKETVPATPKKDSTDDDEDEDDAEDAEEVVAPAVAPLTPAKTEKRTPAKKEFQAGLKELQASILELSKKAGATAVRRDTDFQKSRIDLDEQLTDLEKSARTMHPSEEDKATLVRLGGELDVLEHRTKPGFWDSALALILSIYGALSVAQAVVIALSRDYHASIARDASLLLGVAPEDPPMVPRVRLNWAWIRRKLKQRTRSLFVFLPGVALIYIAALPFPQRALLTSVLTSLWAVYWWVVWTASKSARAWEREGVARSPWFLRLWHDHVAPLPLIGWMAKMWEGLWANFTRSAYSPAEAVEAQPVEFAGLAAARSLQLIPVLKLFVRPLIPVAAARLLAERSLRSERLLTTPNERATLAAERASVPASPGAIEARDEM